MVVSVLLQEKLTANSSRITYFFIDNKCLEGTIYYLILKISTYFFLEKRKMSTFKENRFNHGGRFFSRREFDLFFAKNKSNSYLLKI